MIAGESTRRDATRRGFKYHILRAACRGGVFLLSFGSEEIDEIHADLSKRGFRARKRREKSGTAERWLNSFQTAPASNDRREDRQGYDQTQ